MEPIASKQSKANGPPGEEATGFVVLERSVSETRPASTV